MSLECIECHDRHISDSPKSLGAGTWNHSKIALSHPVGTNYDRASMKKRHKFRPGTTLQKDIKLYEGKIGCGTCHNVYSKEKGMLVIDNRGSRLCLRCHIQ
jgi:predicted CXXCH cytochrome family protein